LLAELLQPRHLLIILIVAVVFFGPQKLPALGNALGRTFKEFKAGTRGILNEEEESSEKKENSVPISETSAANVNSANKKASTWS
jgi:sec-independent protein translocase protein TatA